ncbi:hypothetical protein SPI_07602 [Niveomyces insectorum RCEF 264]|uniref:Uncharacterized protein n=1 Tax=Niveomyces insectorum RCEF 264 TaxID=1081102 RepID=A0A162IFZ0_9HYPO|nr:hypothetical protein SPI_07602 [Niveomyces insectorum RCEF 264]
MGHFFSSWQLWEEMTFVLACAIAIVFLIGLFKLWRSSRQVRRQELIDEEKRARLTEMRKVGGGLSPTTRKRNSDIPFGVRAIQSGVEIDGIWISRPNTPSRSSSKSKMGLSMATTVAHSTTLNVAAADKNIENDKDGRYALHPALAATDDNDSDKKNRTSSISSITSNVTASVVVTSTATSTTNNNQQRPYSGSTLGSGRPASQRTANGWSTPVVGSNDYLSTLGGGGGPPGAADAFDTHSNMSTPLPQISEDATFPSRGLASISARDARDVRDLRRLGALNEEALRHLEGAYSPTPASALMRGAPQAPTYLPNSGMPSPSPSPSPSLSPGLSSSSNNRQHNYSYQTHHVFTAAAAAAATNNNHYYRPSNSRQHTSTASADSLTSSNAYGGSGLGGGSDRSMSSHSSRSSRSSIASTSSRHQTSVERLRQQQQQQQQHQHQHYQHYQQYQQKNEHDDLVGPLPSPVRLAAPSHTHMSPPASPTAPFRAYPYPYSSPRSSSSSSPSPQASPTTFGPADTFANRATRKVNPGFEVLPAGTFGAFGSLAPASSSRNTAFDDEDEAVVIDGRGQESPRAPKRNKLRRATVPAQSRT